MASKPGPKVEASVKAVDLLQTELRLSESRYLLLVKENTQLNQKLRKVEARRDALEWALVLAQNVVRRLHEEAKGNVSADWVKVAF